MYTTTMYCVKCKAEREGLDPVEITMKNGRKAQKSKCPVCGTMGFRILKKSEGGGGGTRPPLATA